MQRWRRRFVAANDRMTFWRSVPLQGCPWNAIWSVRLKGLDYNVGHCSWRVAENISWLCSTMNYFCFYQQFTTRGAKHCNSRVVCGKCLHRVASVEFHWLSLIRGRWLNVFHLEIYRSQRNETPFDLMNKASPTLRTFDLSSLGA